VKWGVDEIQHQLLMSPEALGDSPYQALQRIDVGCYVAAKATYIRLLHGKIGILEGFFDPSSVHRGLTHIVFG